MMFSFKQLASDQSTTKSLLESVIQIGRIDSIQLWSDAKRTYGNLQFHLPGHATQLLNQSNRTFGAAVVRFWEAENQSTNNVTTVLNLNNFCLQKIFGYLVDMSSVAEVNERFKHNAKLIFPLKYKPFVYGNTAESTKVDAKS